MDAAPATTSWVALRRFVRPRAEGERCELCSDRLAGEHRHLVEPTTRRVLCVCEPCGILFSHRAEMKYRRVPQRFKFLRDFQLSEMQWNALRIPIGLAFFFYSSPKDRVVAMYPSAAGPTESLLDLDAWNEVVEANPLLSSLEPDTEALLANRIGEAREHYVVPIDACYRLVGLLRTHWQGFSGGAEVWNAIGEFFEDLRNRTCPI
jgi:hypothetical protein